MAPLLRTTAACVCRNTPLKDKSLQEVTEHGLIEAENPPSYEVKLKKSKVSFKPTTKGAEKIKPIKLDKVTDSYVIEKSDVIALCIPHKKKPTCLALRFNDTNARKEFQTLAKTSASNSEKSKRNKKNKKKESKSKKSQQDKASAENKYESTLQPLPERPTSSTITLSDVEGPRTSSSRRPHEEMRQSVAPSSANVGSSVCSHCHQKLPNRMMATKIEYDPPKHLPSLSPRQRARSYDFSLGGSNGSVCYIGPRSSTRKSYQPSSKERGQMFYHRTHLRDSPSCTRSDESYGSSSTSTTSTPYDGHFMRVGTISCRTPVPQHTRSPRLKTTVVEPSPTKQTLRRNKSQSIVYYLWDSSGEEDESWDYQSKSTSMGESASSYDNSVPNIVSDRSKKIDKLLHELGKPGAIRLY